MEAVLVQSATIDAVAAVRIRPLVTSDLPTFLDLVDALADSLRLARPDAGARDRLARDVVADPPSFRVLLAERGGRAVGYAAYLEAYSTFLARPTLYLEDLFVVPDERRHGVGRALMRALAREMERRGAVRMEWHVPAGNAATAEFYSRCGAAAQDEWRVFRLVAGRGPLELLPRPPAESDRRAWSRPRADLATGSG
jgi:GNAT superfamily N-acetyltransferase